MEAKRSKTKLVVSLLVLGSTLTFLVFCMAGDPDPGIPSGPVLLSDAQPIPNLPYTISEPGSYHLDQNMTHSSRYTDAIEVNADDVTIDLMGHSLIGRSSTSGTSNGIYMNGRKNVEIRNGTVTKFGNNGIWEEDTGDTASGHRVIGVRVVSNGGSGIDLNGADHTVKDCTASGNGLAEGDHWAGIICGYACLVTGNTVFNNGTEDVVHTHGVDGIATDAGCTITDNTIALNETAGIWPYHGCTITGNTSFNNGFAGIYVSGNGSLVRGNTLRWNGFCNIIVDGTHNAIEENLLTASLCGIWFMESGNFYANNRALDNAVNYDDAPAPGSSGDGGGNVAYITLDANNNAELQKNVQKNMQKRLRTE
jgi:parallel beta-helix repeat protein